MTKSQVRGNILVALAVMIAGGASGVALSLAARAQVDTFGDRSEHGNPGDPVGQLTYCVYLVSRKTADCVGEGGPVPTSQACTVCVRPECPDYGVGRPIHNAQVTNTGCQAFFQLIQTTCTNCDQPNNLITLQPL